MDELPSEAEIKGDILTISNGEALEFESLKEKIIKLGYDREAQVDGPGQFAVRGGIIDIYPLTEELPIRIEFWGDEVDSIRTFDVDSQRSVENLEQIVIYPADDRLGSDRKVSFINYFDPKDTLVFLDEPARLLEKGRLAENEVEKARENRAEEMERTGEMEEAPEFFTTDEIIKFLNKFCMIGMCALEMKCKPFFVKKRFGIQAKSVNPYNSSFEMLTQDLKRLKRNGYRAVLISGSRTRAKRLAEDLRDYDLSSFYSEEMERQVNPGEIMVTCGYISEGYEYPMLKFTVISESDIFGKKKKKKKKKDEEDEPEPTKFLPVNVGAPSSMDVYGSISLTFDEPIARFDSAAIHLKEKVDTLWKDIPFEFEQDSLNLKRFNLYYDWEPGNEYEFSVDSTAFHGIYGLFTDKIKQGFKVRKLEEYASITFLVTGADSTAFVELLDAQDKVVRQRRLTDGGYADFYFLNPGKYCARLVNDRNGNGIWDTGNFEKGEQPEEVYYYNMILEPKANWDLDKQSWDIHAIPLDKQKLDELKKQKPDEDKKKKDRDRNSQRRR